MYNAEWEGAATDLKQEFRRNSLVCSAFGFLGIILTVLGALVVLSFEDIPNDWIGLTGGFTWTLVIGGFAATSMFVVGWLGVHSSNNNRLERSQVLAGLGIAAFGLGTTAIPVGLLVLGSRGLLIWVFLVLGVAVMARGIIECKYALGTRSEQPTEEEMAR